MQPTLPPSVPPSRTSPTAIWSLVLGILGLLCFSFLTGIPAVICGHIAYGKIKRSGGLLQGSGLAIGGLVTGYISIAMAVLVIPLLLSIAVPNFQMARRTAQQNACINYLRMIDGATQTWALEHKKPAEAMPMWDDLTPYLKEKPQCPAGGAYQLSSPAGKPTCSIDGHELPEAP